MSAEYDGVHPYPVSAGSGKDQAARSRAARIASNTRWAHEPDRVAATQAMRDAQQRKFEDEVDPERVLPPAELARRVASLKSAHYTRLASRRRKSA